MTLSEITDSYHFLRDSVELFTECMNLGVAETSELYNEGYRKSSDLASRLGELENRGNTLAQNCSPMELILGVLAYTLLHPLKTKRALEYNRDNLGLKVKRTVTRN